MEALIALLALTVMEIVLGIDNIVFISVLTGKLPAHQQAFARWLGLMVAMGTRILLLLGINWIMHLKEPVFEFSQLGLSLDWLPTEKREEVNMVSWKDLIMLIGGLFLLQSSVREIHHKMEGDHDSEHHSSAKQVTWQAVVTQILFIDIIFSLDSVITAVGVAKDTSIMITAIILAVITMMFFAGAVSAFVERHPTVKMLALSFLLLIGVMLLAGAIGTHIEKGYIYFAMGFSLLVEMLNLRAQRKKQVKPLVSTSG